MLTFLARRLYLLRLLLAGGIVFAHNAVYPASIESLLMPGEVIEGHAKYEQECAKCHERFGKRNQTSLCRDCHKDINRDITANQGYHGRHKQIRKQECSNCHTEHRGRKADIVKLDTLTFDHHLTDYPLRGGHQKIPCQSCHKPKQKYREAPGNCYSCHKNNSPHQATVMGKLAKQCDSCHTEKTWREIRYDHNKTKFPLTGKHFKTDCASCHPSDRFLNTPKDCYSCHRLDDVHQGSNGQNCKKCHTTKSWKKLDFDHDKDTDFPLRGRHEKLACVNCHKEDPYKVKIKTDCLSCHKHDDVHKGRFGAKCQDCHNETSWSKQRFNHDTQTKFKLRGKHQNINCTACHKQHIYDTKLKMDCFACHKVDDVHKGKEGKDCARCHNENGWRRNVRFDHDITKFPLIGLHAVVPCEECHLSSVYTDASTGCNNCHKPDDTHRGKLGIDCQRCHTPNSWQIWRFDHNTQSKFKLDGAHVDVHCHSCHTRSVEKVASEPRTCINCHRNDDEHNGQFGSRCDRCHTTKSFKDINMRR